MSNQYIISYEGYILNNSSSKSVVIDNDYLIFLFYNCGIFIYTP